MIRCLKPARLWCLTGKKHVQRMLQDRIKAFPPQDQRNQREVIKLLGILSVPFVGLAYSFGLIFPPPLDDSNIMKESPCRVKKTVIKQDKDSPCPEVVYPKVPKCKKPQADKDDRQTCDYD